MPTLRLIGFTCLKRQEPGRDEPYLALHGASGRRTIWGPTSMADAQAVSLAEVSPRWFNAGQTLEIEAWEHDEGRGNDDLIGTLTVTERDVGLGEQQNLFSAHGAQYRATFEVVAERPSEEIPDMHLLHLDHLACMDALGAVDRTFITVNDVKVWGPQEMRTGEDQRVSVAVRFHRSARVDLWEEKPGTGAWHLGTHSAGSDPADLPGEMYFHKGVTAVDARYMLHYHVTEAVPAHA